MESFSTDEVAQLSGLSRGQIDQLLSRWGIGIFGGSRGGVARKFLPADAFMVVLAGELNRFGINQREFSEVWARLGLIQLDSMSELPIETYPGQLRHNGEASMAIVWLAGDEYRVVWSPPDRVQAVIAAHKITTAIIVDAGAIAARIDAFAESGDDALDT